MMKHLEKYYNPHFLRLNSALLLNISLQADHFQLTFSKPENTLSTPNLALEKNYHHIKPCMSDEIAYTDALKTIQRQFKGQFGPREQTAPLIVATFPGVLKAHHTRSATSAHMRRSRGLLSPQHLTSCWNTPFCLGGIRLVALGHFRWLHCRSSYFWELKEKGNNILSGQFRIYFTACYLIHISF